MHFQRGIGHRLTETTACYSYNSIISFCYPGYVLYSLVSHLREIVRCLGHSRALNKMMPWSMTGKIHVEVAIMTLLLLINFANS